MFGRDFMFTCKIMLWTSMTVPGVHLPQLVPPILCCKFMLQILFLSLVFLRNISFLLSELSTAKATRLRIFSIPNWSLIHSTLWKMNIFLYENSHNIMPWQETQLSEFWWACCRYPMLVLIGISALEKGNPTYAWQWLGCTSKDDWCWVLSKTSPGTLFRGYPIRNPEEERLVYGSLGSSREIIITGWKLPLYFKPDHKTTEPCASSLFFIPFVILGSLVACLKF